MAYTFAIVGDAVFVTSNTTTYIEVIQDVAQITTSIPKLEPTNPYFHIYRKYNPIPFTCRLSEIYLVDGKGGDPTIAGNLANFNLMFTTAVAGIYS